MRGRLHQGLSKAGEHASRTVNGGATRGVVVQLGVEDVLETAPGRGGFLADGVEPVVAVRVELAQAADDQATAEGGAFDDVEFAPAGRGVVD